VTETRPTWQHREGDRYMPIRLRMWMNETGHGTWYTVLDAPSRQHERAVRRGLAAEGTDDFQIAVLRGGRLVAMLWMDEVVDDAPDTLAEVAEQIGAHPVTGGDAPRADVTALREAASAVRAFDQSQQGWNKTFDRGTVRAMADMIDAMARERATRFASFVLTAVDDTAAYRRGFEAAKDRIAAVLDREAEKGHAGIREMWTDAEVEPRDEDQAPWHYHDDGCGCCALGRAARLARSVPAPVVERDDIGRVPEGWRVLWCRTEDCLASLAWTDDIIEGFENPDEWFAMLDWATKQVQHGWAHGGSDGDA
jgi:hypothetical protein